MDDLTQKLNALSVLGPWEWPEGGKELVLHGLQAETPEARLAALENAGESFDRDLLTVTMELLRNDPEAAVRAAAAISLGPSLEMMFTEVDDDVQSEADLDADLVEDLPLSLADYRALEEQLRSIVLDEAQPEEVRRRSLEAAVRSPRPWQKDSVRQAFTKAETAWRMTAVFCAGYLEGFRGEIAEAMEHEDAEVQMEAIRAAGEMEIEALGPEILDLAKDEDALVPLRLAAMDALVSLRPDGTIPFLEKMSQGEGELAEMADLAMQDLLSLELAEVDDPSELTGLWDDEEDGDADGDGATASPD